MCEKQMHYVLYVYVAQVSKEETQSSEPKVVKKGNSFSLQLVTSMEATYYQYSR